MGCGEDRSGFEMGVGEDRSAYDMGMGEERSGCGLRRRTVVVAVDGVVCEIQRDEERERKGVGGDRSRCSRWGGV